MLRTTHIQCRTKDDAEALRSALKEIDGIEVENELFAKATTGTDIALYVSFAIPVALPVLFRIAANKIIDTLSERGYTEIKINQKISILNISAIQQSIEGRKTQETDNDRREN